MASIALAWVLSCAAASKAVLPPPLLEATGPVSEPEEWAPYVAPAAQREDFGKRRRQALTRAQKLVGLASLKKATKKVPDDCSGLVRLAYESAGVELMRDGRPGDNAVTTVHRWALRAGAIHQRTPVAGDLVFFRETYDRNRDGRRNDGLTHIGIVEAVADDGTITFIHRGMSGVARSRLNRAHPEQRLDGSGQVLNDFIRARSKKSRAYLAGELFVGFASFDDLASAETGSMNSPSGRRAGWRRRP
jgi:hypothetical protein